MKARNSILALALLGLPALPATAQATPAPAPSLKALAISAPTNLPPKQSEVQRLSVEAEGGSFKLSFEGDETGALEFDESAAEVQAALQSLPKIGPGNVTVSGGPGGDAAHPYFIAFGGEKADADVAGLSVDPAALTGEHPFAHLLTTVPGGAGTGTLIVLPANNGGATTSVSVPTEVDLGPLPAGVVTAGPAIGTEWECPGSAAGQSTVHCITTKSIAPLAASPYPINVPVEVSSETPLEEEVPVTIKGGGGSLEDESRLPIVVSTEPASFGVAAWWAGAYEADGSPSVQAGAHPFSGASYFMVNTVRTHRGEVSPAEDARDALVDLQPGFIGNPLATKRCPQSVLLKPGGYESPLCTSEMSVGTLSPYVGSLIGSINFENQGLFNDVPAYGYPGEFSTKLVNPIQSLLASLRSEEDYGVRVSAFNNANVERLFGAFAAFEGTPKEGTGKALLTNSTDCAEQARKTPVVSARLDSWQHPGVYVPAPDVALAPITGCGELSLHPSFSLQPTSTQGSSPVGATAHLHLPDTGLTEPEALAEPQLKKAVVKLPEGLDLNPSSANGLQTCTEAQIGYKGGNYELPNPMRFSDADPSCPDGSKLGTVEVSTPLLENPLVGQVYLAAQEENPFGSLLAIYLVVDDPAVGVVVKLAGRIDTDPNTGQITTTFDYSPQLPFEDLTINFRGGGPRSELASPEVCGPHTTTGSWEPWSAPQSGPDAQTADTFDVAGNCAASPGARPFAPSFEAGTTNPIAGAYSPLVVKVKRNDGEQELRRLDFTLPGGLAAKLAGMSYCSDADIATAQNKSGREEQAHPSCPASTRLGSVDAAAGVGSEPFHTAGDVYLAGRYKGAPISAVVITPAVAGPFDLGNVVIRNPLYIDENTAQVTVKSDPIPTILDGIPLKVREVAIQIDRGDFTFNPTSCEATQVTASIRSSDGATATPDNRFQVGGCENLAFKPRTYFRLYGATKRGAHPKVRAVYETRPGEANLLSGAFTIPRSEFLDQAHIRTICTRVQFAANACPKGAIYGHVKAFSPIVDYPVQGPVYLRSSDHNLPDLVFDLRGPVYQPVHVVVALRIDSHKGQIRVTAEGVPDLPVSKLIFTQQGGKKGLLINSRNICTKAYRADVATEGHNGKTSEFRPVLSNSKCKKARKHHKKRHKGHHKRSGRR